MSGKTAKSYLPQMRKCILTFPRRRSNIYVLSNYSIEICILTFLRRRFNGQETRRIYGRVQQLEKTYRREEPYIGGKDNMMSDNLYQAYWMFALYEAMGRKLTVDDIQEIIDIYFARAMAHVPKKLDLSVLIRAKPCVGAIYKYMEHYAAKANAKKGKEWGNTWGIKVDPDNRQTGLALNLVGCPLADFARKHDMLEILPALCNIDHRTVEAFGLKLYRDKTVSNGDEECAYWVVSGKSAEADSFVNEKNPDGLILSRMKSDV